MLFERGSSKISDVAKKQLSEMANLLIKYKKINIEIQGHVCCTPPYQKEAIDMATQKRELSTNRAMAVYNYFVAKGIKKDRLTHNHLAKNQNLIGAWNWLLLRIENSFYFIRSLIPSFP